MCLVKYLAILKHLLRTIAYFSPNKNILCRSLEFDVNTFVIASSTGVLYRLQLTAIAKGKKKQY